MSVKTKIFSIKKSLFYISLFIFSWVYSLLYPFIDNDLWARLAVGKIFFQLGHVIKNDIFSYTETKPVWIDHEWGSGVIFYFLAHHFGDIGIYLFKILGFFIILVLISKVIQLQNTKPDSHLNLFFYFVIVLAIFHGLSWTIRSQLFTFIFFTLWIYVLERVRRGENRLLWIIPATTLIWANLHGGFVAGLGLVGIYGVGELLNRKPFKKYFLILIPSVLVTLINPYGIDYWFFISNATTMPRDFISEWRPTNLFGPLGEWKGYKLLLIVLILSQILILRKYISRFKELDKVKYLLLLVTLFLSLRFYKHQPLFVIACGCFIYHDFYRIFSLIGDFITGKSGEIGKKLLNSIALIKDVAIFGIIIVAGIALIATHPFKIIIGDHKYPVGSVEFIRINNLSGNLLTSFGVGSYAAWKLYPNCLIAIDGRYEEVYPEKVFLMVHNFYHRIYKEYWDDLIKTYHTDIIIADKKTDTYYDLVRTNYWQEVYSDRISAVFMPRNKVKKSYIIPKITEKTIIEDKYETKIDFLN